MKAGRQTDAEPSWASLLTGIADEAKELLLQEVALTKLEVRYELVKAKSAAISLGIAIGTIAIGSMLLALMLVHGLAALTAVPLWGCYGIVGGAITAIGAGALVVARIQGGEAGSDAASQPRRWRACAEPQNGECAMTDKPDVLLQDELENARRVVAESRAAFGRKLGMLDDRVQETVTDVKHVFDFDYQMHQRPWVMVGGSVLAGYTLARLVGAPRGARTSRSSVPDSPPRPRAVNASRVAAPDGGASVKGEVFDVVKGTLWALAKQAFRLA